jgi:signal transduction histidine kinase
LVSICDEIILEHRLIRDRDYRVQREGHRVTLRAGCTMLMNRQREQIGMVFHVRDVTEKALIEERLRRMERYIGLGSLAAGLQHEIKNPLSALSLHIQLLDERLQRMEEDREVHQMLEVLKSGMKRIGDVFDGFRNYASIHAIGRPPSTYGP